MATIHFILADDSRCSADLAIVATSSDVIRTAAEFAHGQNKSLTEYSLAEWPPKIAHAVIDVMCGTFDMGSEVAYDDWIAMIQLADFLAVEQLSSIIRLRTRVTDVTGWLVVAKMLSLKDMINVITDRNITEEFLQKVHDAMSNIDTKDVKWYLDAIENIDFYREMLAGAIVSRETSDEQRQLIPRLTARVPALRHEDFSRAIIDPVLRHAFKIMVDAFY